VCGALALRWSREAPEKEEPSISAGGTNIPLPKLKPKPKPSDKEKEKEAEVSLSSFC
jgi:hypothetical protein